MLETVAGKHRANDIASLLQNWDNVRKMQESATNATGSAAAEQEKYMQSMQGHLDQLSASWQAFSSSTMESGFMNGIIDGARGALEAITALIDKVGILPTLLGVVSGALSFKNIGFVSLQKDVDKLIPSLKVFGTTIEDYKTMWDNFGNARKEGNGFMDSLSTIFDKDSGKTIKAQSNDFVNTMKANERTILEFNSALSAQTHPTHELVDSLFEVGQAGEHASESLKKTMHELVDMKKVDSNNLLDGEALRQAQIDEHINGLANDKGISGRLKALDMFNKQYKEIGITQKEVAERFTKAGDVGMGTYLSKSLDKAAASGKQAKAGIVGYIGTLVKAKAATIGLEVASMALNTALSMGIGMLVSFGVEALMSWINRADEIAEKASDVKSSFEEQKKTLSDAKSTADELSESYAKLSQGVDTSNNKNISLNSEDYEKYLSVVREIGETFPSLIQGYDSQGNAILSCKGNVEELTQAYDEMAKKANNDVLKNVNDLAEDSKNKAQDLENHGGTRGYDALKKIYNSEDVAKDLLGMDSTTLQRLTQDIEKAGFKMKSDGSENERGFIQRAMQENRAAVKAALDDYESQMNEAAEGMKTIAEATIGNALLDQYSGLSDNMKQVMQNLVSGMDYDFFNSDKIGWDASKLESYIGNALSSINNLSADGKNKIDVFFDIQSKMNKGDCTVGDYVKGIDDVNNAISGLDEDTQYQIKMSMGIEDDDFMKQYNDFVDKLVANDGLTKEAAKKITNGLSKEEFQAFVELEAEGEINFDNVSTESIKKQLEDRVAQIKAEKFSLDITSETEGLEKLNEALAQSRSATGLTEESIESIKSRYKDLEGYDPSAIFEKTTTGVRLNVQALQSLEEQYVSTNKAAADQKLNALAQQYKEIQALRDKEKKGSAEYKQYDAQLDGINDEIEAVNLAKAAYEGLTSSYNKWVNAKSGGQAGDIYDQMLEGRENAKSLAKEGKWGNTELQSYVEMFSSPDSLDGAKPQDYADAWKSAISKSNRYFQEGKKGINNFIADAAAANSKLAKQNKDGSWEIAPNFNVKDWAKALKISESAVEAEFGQMEEYGFDVPIGVDTTSIDDAVKDSKKATEALKSTMGDDFKIEVNTDVKSADEASNEIEDLKKKRDEINNSSAEVKVKEQGVEATNEAIEAVINKKIELEQPSYMKLDASNVKSTMTDALSALKNYQNAVDQVTRLKEMKKNGIKVDTKELDSAKSKIDETAKTIAQLDGKVKIAIGLDSSDGVDDVKKKIEDGKVKLTVDTDIDKSATEEMASNVEKIEDKNVTITATVNGLDQVKDLTESIELATSIDGNVDALSKFADAAKQLDGVDSDIVKTVTADLYGNLDNDSNAYNLANLDKFADSAKKLDGVGSPYVEVTANLESNLNDNGNVSKLDEFAEGAKKLQDVSSSDVTVKANLDANIGGFLGYNADLDNIDKFAEGAEKLSGVSGADVEVNATLNANIGGFLGYNADLDNIDRFAEGAERLAGVSDADVTVNANLNANIGGILGYNPDLNNIAKFAEGAEMLADVSDASVTVNATLNANAGGILGYNPDLNNIDKFADGAKKLQELGDSDVTVKAHLEANTGGILGYNPDLNNIDKFADAADRLKNVDDASVNVSATLEANTGGILGYNPDLNNIDKFAEGAKKLEGISDSSVTVEAHLEANTGGFLGSNPDLDNLDKFAESAKKLQGISDSDVTVNAHLEANTGGFLGNNPDLDNLDKFAEGAKKLSGVSDSDVEVNATLIANFDDGDVHKLPEFADAAEKLQGVGSPDVKVKANLEGDINTSTVNNIDAFAEGAKKLQGVGDADVTVTANLAGSGIGGLINTEINNLNAFAEGANKLKGVGDVSSTVTANLEGSGIGGLINTEINNLGAFADGANKLKGVGDVSSTVTANLEGDIGGQYGYNAALNNLGAFADGAKKLSGVASKTVNLEANLNGNLADKSAAIGNLPSFASSASKLQGLSSKEITITPTISGDLSSDKVSMLSKFGSVVSSLPSSKTVSVTVSANTDKIASVKSSLQSLANSGVLKNYSASISATVNMKINSAAVDSYSPKQKDGKVEYTVNSSKVDSWKPPKKDGTVNYKPSVSALTDSQLHKTGTITYKAKVEGGPGTVDGTAHAKGTALANGTTGKAFAKGSWGAKESGVALGGELGQELVN